MTARKPDGSQPSTKRRASSSSRSCSRRSSKTIKAAIDDFRLDRQSQNHSPQTLRWHTIVLDHFVTFLEKQHTLTYLQDLEAVHIRAWLVFLEKEVGPRGKVRAARTRRWYAKSMHASPKSAFATSSHSTHFKGWESCRARPDLLFPLSDSGTNSSLYTVRKAVVR